ncbi:MAG TPA: lysophospholipid acyltransferase family protein [Candidatus Dormibacteraeota bacterium]|nr:lysophospholipid acyltransferase family protein [Candidatus Dormibacteraeota bacterium]
MNGESEQRISVSAAAGSPEERGVRRAWSILRSTYRWLLCASYFFPVCSFLVLLGIFVDPRKNDGAQRMLCRTTMKLAGAKLVVRRAPGFDPQRTCFLLINHVNLFDPFVLYATVPQFFRGLELESHFHIPVYGWMMKRFGNVPVPDNNRPSDLKRMWRLSRAALDSGVSLAVFAEGQRTLDGRVGPFKDGVFRMALQFGTPIIPVSVVGAFEFNKKTSWLLRPGTVTVHLHDVIETKDLRKEDVPALRDRVHAIISRPVEEALAEARGEACDDTRDAAHQSTRKN